MATTEQLKTLLGTLTTEETYEQQIEWHIRNNFDKCQLRVREQADDDIGAILGVSADFEKGRIGKVSTFTQSIVTDFKTIDKLLGVIDDVDEESVLVSEIGEDIRRKKTSVAKASFENIAQLYHSTVLYTDAEPITQIMSVIAKAKEQLKLLGEINDRLTNTVEVVA